MERISERNKVFFLLLFIVGMSMVVQERKIVPDDLLTHIKIGEWIWNNKSIPKYGVFSWYAMEQRIPYTYHEWLSEVISYWYDRVLGFEISSYLQTVIYMSLILSFLFISKRKDVLTNYRFSTAWILMGVGAIASVSSARPHMYGLLFFSVLMYCLEKLKENEDSEVIRVLPLITVFWANFHGGSVVLSYGMCFLYFFVSIFSERFHDKIKWLPFKRFSKKQVKKYLSGGLFCILSSCINPYGINLFLYTFSHFGENSDRKWIMEWKAPSLTSCPYIFFLITFLFLFFYKSKKKIEFSDLLVVGFFILLTLLFCRFVAWLFIASNYIVFRYSDGGNELSKKHENNVFVYLICGTVLILFSLVEISINRGVSSVAWLSDESIEVLKENGFKRLYCHNSIGNILIYEGFDSFLDMRGEMYAPFNLDDGMNFAFGDTVSLDPNEFMDKYDFDGYVVENIFPANYHLSKTDGLDCIYTDEMVSIYKKIK